MTDKMELEAAVGRVEHHVNHGRVGHYAVDDLRLILASHAALTERVGVLEDALNFYAGEG